MATTAQPPRALPVYTSPVDIDDEHVLYEYLPSGYRGIHFIQYLLICVFYDLVLCHHALNGQTSHIPFLYLYLYSFILVVLLPDALNGKDLDSLVDEGDINLLQVYNGCLHFKNVYNDRLRQSRLRDTENKTFDLEYAALRKQGLSDYSARLQIKSQVSMTRAVRNMARHERNRQRRVDVAAGFATAPSPRRTTHNPYSQQARSGAPTTSIHIFYIHSTFLYTMYLFNS